jgi:NAD(P)H-dependent FMN reductase
MRRKQLLIVWCSTTGASEQLSKAIFDGASLAAQEVDAELLHCERAGIDKLLASDLLITVCPEHLGSMAGPMKTWFDSMYYPALGKLQGKAYWNVVSAGSDGAGTVRQLQRILTGWRMKPSQQAWIVNTNAQTEASILAPKQLGAVVLKQASETGVALATGLSVGVF